MRVWKINPQDVANGPGVRVSLFVTGCHNMPCAEHCFNKDIQSFQSGDEWSHQHLQNLHQHLSHSYISGLTVLGGEPMLNAKPLTPILRDVRKQHPDKTIWLYSGFTLDQILANKTRRELLTHVDVLVDGPFVPEKHSEELRFRGSSNQRIIDVQATLENGSVVLLEMGE